MRDEAVLCAVRENNGRFLLVQKDIGDEAIDRDKPRLLDDAHRPGQAAFEASRGAVDVEVGRGGKFAVEIGRRQRLACKLGNRFRVVVS